MAASTVPTPESAPLSPFQRIINIFVAPTSVFNDLRRDPSWWAAWLLISVFAIGFMYSMDKKVGFDQVTRNEISASAKTSEALDKLPAEQREQRLAISAKITRYFSYGAPISVLIIAAIMAAVLLATFNFGMGAEMKFGAALAVVLWAWVPGILKSILGAISLFAGADPEAFNIRNPVATNLGFFISRTDHPVLYSLASSVDIFAIWYIILMGIGFAAVSKVKRGTATWAVAGWYILITLLGAGWIALFS